jgi:hypothetical protein
MEAVLTSENFNIIKIWILVCVFVCYVMDKVMHVVASLHTDSN